jgi:hypothetical protein
LVSLLAYPIYLLRCACFRQNEDSRRSQGQIGICKNTEESAKIKGKMEELPEQGKIRKRK